MRFSSLVIKLPFIYCITQSIIKPENESSQFTIYNPKRVIKKGRRKMSSNKNLVPEAKAALEQFKMEAASEVGVNLKNGYNGDLTSRQAGSVGGQMVKKMIEKYENDLKGNK